MDIKEEIMNAILGSPEIFEIAMNTDDVYFNNLVKLLSKDVDAIVLKIKTINDKLIDEF